MPSNLGASSTLCTLYHVHLILWAVGTLCASYIQHIIYSISYTTYHIEHIIYNISYRAYHIQHDIQKRFVFWSWYCIAGHVYFWFHMVSLRSDLYKATATQNTFPVSTSRSLHSRFRGNWPCLLWKGQSWAPWDIIQHWRQEHFQTGMRKAARHH